MSGLTTWWHMYVTVYYVSWVLAAIKSNDGPNIDFNEFESKSYYKLCKQLLNKLYADNQIVSTPAEHKVKI